MAGAAAARRESSRECRRAVDARRLYPRLPRPAFPPELSPGAREALLGYSWPGNVRELRNAIERATILWPAPLIETGALPERIAAHSSRAPRLGGDFTLEEIEREHVLSVIARTATLDEAAKILGIDASTLWRKRKRYTEG